jgi:hypothetical protein
VASIDESKDELKLSPPVLVVCISDTVSGGPVAKAQIDIGKPYVIPSLPSVDPVSGHHLSENRLAWFAITDSSGCARITGFPEGERYVHVCSEVYGHGWAQVLTSVGKTHTLRFKLRHLGYSGHRCKVLVQFDGVEDSLKKEKP